MTVHVLGSINLDHFLLVDTLPRPGETISAGRTFQMPGGKGGNQAIAAARMGAEVHMIGAVGDDAAGDELRRFIAGNGIDIAAVERHARHATGAAYIARGGDGENQIIVAPGANAALSPAAAGASMLGAKVALAQLETPLDSVGAFFDAARQAGAIRILNAAPATAAARALLPQADILIVNQTELAILLGTDRIPVSPEDALQARALLTRPCQQVIVTLGGQGAVLVDQGRFLHVPGLAVSVIDTTGAGDCFCGAVAALLCEGLGWETILDIANAAAAQVVQREGAAGSMPTRGEVDALRRS